MDQSPLKTIAKEIEDDFNQFIAKYRETPDFIILGFLEARTEILRESFAMNYRKIRSQQEQQAQQFLEQAQLRVFIPPGKAN